MLGTLLLLLVLSTIGWAAQPRNSRKSFPPTSVSTTTLLSIPQVTVYIQTTTTSREREWLEATPRTFSGTNHYALSNDTEITNREVPNDLLDEGPHERLRDLTSHLGNQTQAASRPFQSISSSSSSISESTSPRTTTSAIPSGNFTVSASASVYKTLSSVGTIRETETSSVADLPQSSTRFTTVQVVSGCILLYVVQDRDTCVSITGEFRMSLGALFHLNSVLDHRCENLKVGQFLCLRDVSSAAAGAPPSTGYHGPATTMPKMTRTTQTTTAEMSSTTTSLGFRDCYTYLVKADDTCKMIAARNKLSLKEFLKLNPDLKVLDNGNCPLDVGQTVCIRGPSQPPAPTPTTKPEASSTQGRRPGNTPVSKGDHGSSHVPTSLEVIPIDPTGMAM